MLCRTLRCVTNYLVHLTGATLKKLSSGVVESSAAGGIVFLGACAGGAPMPAVCVDSLADYCMVKHEVQAYDHVVVSEGSLRGTVLNMCEDALFEACFVAYSALGAAAVAAAGGGAVPAVMAWGQFVQKYVL